MQNKFFIFNPKSYLCGEELLELALVADEVAMKYPQVSVFVTCPYADIYRIAKATNHIIVTAQHLDGIKKGRGMGAVLPEAVYGAGARATFLNHAEHPMTLANLVAAIKRTKELGMVSIVCADSVEEAVAIGTLSPDVLLCEPTELIGTGQTSDDSYMIETNQAIKQRFPGVLMMQGAGIMTASDVYHAIKVGADGAGCTSGIVKAENPKQMLFDMVEAVVRAVEEV